ncbi:MAG: AEC family transporter [Coleofasciculaceae cyanobacterium SM2_1_6]|nr:AEC family transporter [Coleofasciculaceae cyanobacterium SM2_1_6]
MIEELTQAYIPLVIWIGLGLIFSRLTPDKFLKFLGQGLYWVGVPLQLFVLARQTDTTKGLVIPVTVAIAVLLLSLAIALVTWFSWQWFQQLQSQLETNLDSKSPEAQRATLGSFVLATILGNTGFVGLTLTQVLTSHDHSLNNNWAVLFSVTNNVVGTYGLAILIASYFGQKQSSNHWWTQLQAVATVPSLWTFFLGLNTQFVQLPAAIETGLDQAVLVVIALALLLVGLRLGMIKGRASLPKASLVSVIKVFIIPLLVGLGATYWGVTGEERLVLVLMSGTPTGLSVLILAEVYDLDRDLLASSIALTFLGLFLALPLWLFLFT